MSRLPPDHVRCAACRKLMHAESYAHGEPLPGRVAADRITREYRAAGPYRTLRCTCGHYTIHAPVPGPAT